MSYILDALRRADQERNLGEVPKLDMALQPAPEAERARRWPTALLIICLATGVAVAAWFIEHSMFDDAAADSAEPQAQPQLATITEPQATPQPAIPKPQPVPPAQQLSPPQASQQQVQLQQLQSQPQVQAAAPPESVTAPPPPVAQAVQEPVDVYEPPARASVVLPDSEPRTARLPTPTVAPAPSPSWARDETAQPRRSAPAPREGLVSYLGLPKTTRDSMPTLNMNAHVFSTNPARGFVLINSKRYRIGDYLAEGPELVDILPDGAVLKHRGTEFLLPVQR